MPPSIDGSTAADIVVSTLEANGVSVVFGLPGEENLPLVSAMRRAGLPLVVCRHEQHAGFMAVAHSRLTGSLAVCLATLGPGALNLFTALAQGELMHTPVLAITGQKAQTGNAEGSFQVIDVVGSARPLITSAVTVRDPTKVGSVLANAIRQAITAPKGAVLVELPEDVAAARVESTVAQPVVVPGPVADPSVLDQLAHRIASAERPLLLAGSAASARELVDPLRELVEATGLSVLTTQMGKGALSEIHPRSLRSLGIHRPDHAHMALDRADLAVAVGYQPVEHPPLAWQQGRGLPVIHVHTSPASREAGYEPELEVIGELGDTMIRLASTDVVVATGWSDGTRREIEAKLAAEQDIATGIGPLDVVRVVAGLQEPGDVVALDNGAYKIWFARHYPSMTPYSLVLDNALASMGAGLATATEAARCGHRSLAVVGDGGLMMNVGDLETAVRLGVDLTVLVLRDDAYGFIAWHQEEQDRAHHGVDIGNPDFVKLAEAFGGTASAVTTVEQLEESIAAAHDSTGLHLIDCRIDYSINEIL